MTDTESQLAARAAGGDLTALELIYRRHVTGVWRYAWSRTHSRDAAGEIVQETFLRIARGVKKFEGRSAFSTWLFAVTRSATIEHLRRRHREQKGRAEDGVLRLVPAPNDSEVLGGDSEVREAVRQAITKLPPAQRDAIVLFEITGFTANETAEVLGWTQTRVRVTLHRARRRLRTMLQAYASQTETDRAKERR